MEPMKVTIDWPVYDEQDNETVYEIECACYAGTPDVPYLRNGDPGYPGDPAECEILKVSLNGVEVKDWENIKGFDVSKIEDAAYEAANDKAQGQYEDYCERDRDE
jgi:hypothetical protein